MKRRTVLLGAAAALLATPTKPFIVNPYRFGAAAAAIDPADLFAAAEAGGYGQADDLSTLWKDSARTTQVTADGDVVGSWDDKSGNGNHFQQATASQKPLYKTSAGEHWIRGDGVDDQLDCVGNPFVGTVAHSMFFGLIRREVSSNAVYIEAQGTANGAVRQFTAEAALRVNGGNELYDNGAAQDAKAILTNIMPSAANVTDNRCWLNGVELGVSSSASRVINTANDTLRLFRWEGGPINFAFDIYAYAMVAEDKSVDRADMESWLNDRMGGGVL